MNHLQYAIIVVWLSISLGPLQLNGCPLQLAIYLGLVWFMVWTGFCKECRGRVFPAYYYLQICLGINHCLPPLKYI